MNEFLEPIRKARENYSPELVKEILEEGTKKAQEKAKDTMKRIKGAMKIDY